MPEKTRSKTWQINGLCWNNRQKNKSRTHDVHLQTPCTNNKIAMNNNTKYAQVLDDPVARNLRAMIDARISAIDAQELRAGIGRRMMANRNIATTMMARAPLPQLPDLYQQADQRMNNAGSGSFVRHDIITLQHASSVGAKQSTKLLVGIIVLAFIALTVWYICKKRRREQ